MLTGVVDMIGKIESMRSVSRIASENMNRTRTGAFCCDKDMLQTIEMGRIFYVSLVHSKVLQGFLCYINSFISHETRSGN
jgi:hypothetical protein